MNAAELSLRVLAPDADADLVDRLTRGLQLEIREFGAHVSTATAGPAPAGAKSGGAIAVGAIVVSVAPAVVEGLMRVLESWLSRQPSDVELDIDGQRIKGTFTRGQRDQLVQAWVRRLGERP